MLLTESYKAQNKLLHSAGGYGVKGHSYAERIIALCRAVGSMDVLDYGCGQHSMQKSLPFKIREYDPCVDGFDATPEPADIVSCTDVLEHIEPECLDAVLDDLKRVTRKLGFFTVDIRPARKFLSDGRNAHLIQEPAEWWFPKLFARFGSVQIGDILFNSETEPGLIKVLGFVAIVSNPRA